MTLSALAEKKQRNNIEVQRRNTISRWPRNLNQKSGVLRKNHIKWKSIWKLTWFIRNLSENDEGVAEIMSRFLLLP